MKVVVTGASGLLGRAVMKKAQSEGWDVVGLAFSRVGPGLVKVDLTDAAQVQALMEREKPDFVVHAAAERFPDKVENEYEKTKDLNVTASGKLASLAKSVGSRVVYISTDYVFDGTSPPYKVDDKPNPMNKYGVTKLDGERAVTTADPASIVLRIPVLYGPVTYLGESAVTTSLSSLLDSNKPATIPHYEKRCPVHVDDLASIICQLLTKLMKDPSIGGTFQWSGLEVFTKYEMVVAMAEELNLSHKHLSPNSEPSTSRPRDVHMDNSRLEQLGIKAHMPFRQGIKSCLQQWLP